MHKRRGTVSQSFAVQDAEEASSLHTREYTTLRVSTLRRGTCIMCGHMEAWCLSAKPNVYTCISICVFVTVDGAWIQKVLCINSRIQEDSVQIHVHTFLYVYTHCLYSYCDVYAHSIGIYRTQAAMMIVVVAQILMLIQTLMLILILAKILVLVLVVMSHRRIYGGNGTLFLRVCIYICQYIHLLVHIQP